MHIFLKSNVMPNYKYMQFTKNAICLCINIHIHIDQKTWSCQTLDLKMFKEAHEFYGNSDVVLLMP